MFVGVAERSAKMIKETIEEVMTVVIMFAAVWLLLTL